MLHGLFGRPGQRARRFWYTTASMYYVFFSVLGRGELGVHPDAGSALAAVLVSYPRTGGDACFCSYLLEWYGKSICT